MNRTIVPPRLRYYNKTKYLFSMHNLFFVCILPLLPFVYMNWAIFCSSFYIEFLALKHQKKRRSRSSTDCIMIKTSFSFKVQKLWVVQLNLHHQSTIQTWMTTEWHLDTYLLLAEGLVYHGI